MKTLKLTDCLEKSMLNVLLYRINPKTEKAGAGYEIPYFVHPDTVHNTNDHITLKYDKYTVFHLLQY